LAGNSKYHNLVKRRLEPLKEHLGLSHAELEKTFLRLPAVLAYDRVVCGFSWLLRVTDHEAVLMDPKLFSSWVHRSVGLDGRQAAGGAAFSQKNAWVVQVTPQQATKAMARPYRCSLLEK
jgi:hypothetical protein